MLPEILAEFRGCFTQPAHDGFLAENHHGVKQRWRDRLPDDCHADSVDEQAGLYPGGFGHSARGMIAGIVAPIRNGGKSLRGLVKQLFDLDRLFPELFLRRGIAGKLVAEKGARPGCKIRQEPDARPPQPILPSTVRSF